MDILTCILIIIIGVIVIIFLVKTDVHNDKSVKEPVLLDLNTTTVADRQRAYDHGYLQQLRFDELQRKAEAEGDTAILEAIRLGTYTGPLPDLKDADVKDNSAQNKSAKVQELQYFCIKDKGYHVSVWPKGSNNWLPGLDFLEFNIAGMSHRDNIDNYLGEYKGKLEAEPTNPYDPNAIKVLAPDGHHVGYVPKDMTSEIRKHFQLPCSCYIFIGNNNGAYYSDCYIRID